MDCAEKVATTRCCAHRYREHLLAQLICPGRHTITSLLTTNGRVHRDWTAHYSLYARKRVNPPVLFSKIREHIDSIRQPHTPLIVVADDTILRKTGKSIPNAAYRKDPLGPPFNINLVWAQRMIQLSAAVASDKGIVRMIPIDYRDASTPRKPRKGSSQEKWEAYREAMKQTNLNKRLTDMLHQLQQQRSAHAQAPLHLLVDGSYTNRKVLKNLPAHTTLIGRIRKDAKLYYLPEQQPSRGRKRIYGKQAPCPEALRADDSTPWEYIRVQTAGEDRTLRIKTIERLRWRASGDAHDLRGGATLFVRLGLSGRFCHGIESLLNRSTHGANSWAWALDIFLWAGLKGRYCVARVNAPYALTCLNDLLDMLFLVAGCRVQFHNVRSAGPSASSGEGS